MSEDEVLTNNLLSAARVANLRASELSTESAREPVTVRGALIISGSGDATGLPIQSTHTLRPLFPW